MARKMMQVTGERLAEIRSGLAVLKEKRLPSTEAESMVASLWYALKPAFDMYDDIVKKIQAEVRDAEDLEADDKKAAMRQVNIKADDLRTMMLNVPVPKTKLQAQHLPKSHKGKDGEDNPAGNAACIIALGPDYFEFPADTDDTEQ